MPRLTATFCISLPPEMALKIESACRKEHRTRSELVREALRAYLREAEFRALEAKVAGMPEAMPAVDLVRRGRRRKPR
ncbi:MAG: ribbon-helix-helix domain-containing protein [Alphaproteobacteria bacterium]|nr:ribbon-helix-helix domain-containing protein [Alphaproteobacteria bacterium]